MNIQQNVDLFPHTTLRMRVKAKYFTLSRSREDLAEAASYVKNNNLKLIVIGGGSNLAVISSEVDAFVVKNIYMKKEIMNENSDYVDLLVSSGYPVTKLVNETAEEGYEGVEYHLGLPGSVGGALYMNSKWTHPECYFGDSLLKANLLTDDGSIKTVERDYFNFAYDYSILHDTHEVLLEAIFRFKKNDPVVLQKRAKEAKEYRDKTQPHGVASSGCFFQNITDKEMQQAGVHTKSAGNLIDKSGLKNFKKGNFVVSTDHANFIINEGDGKPEDLAILMQTIKGTVKDKFGIELREEVVTI